MAELATDQGSMTTRSLMADEDVLGDLVHWRSEGLRTALVTLVAIDGNTPRPLGAQMAVAEDGRFTGYLSGNCIETSVAKEAQRAIADGRNALVRYGKGSPYFDLKLPCGSGLDLYIDQGLTPAIIDAASAHRQARRPFVLSTNLDTGISTICESSETGPSRLDGRIFLRVHGPAPRVVLVGGGPALVAIATLMAAAGFDLDIVSPDDAARKEVADFGLQTRGLNDPAAAGLDKLDRWTAAIVAFHEHDWEAPVLAQILKSPCFYIGAMGSRAAHANRCAALADLGTTPAALARVRSPIGAIPGSKSRATLAVGILAEVIAEAKAAGLIA